MVTRDRGAAFSIVEVIRTVRVPRLRADMNLWPGMNRENGPCAEA